MDKPEISVILCTYNRATELSKILNDLNDQKFPEGSFPWELILVDNNSNDGTKEYVQRNINKFKFPIQYLFESQQGKSFALNTGVAGAKGEYLAFTDDDVVLDNLWLFSIRRAFQTLDYNCFGGKVLPILDGPLPSWISKSGKYMILGGPLVQHDRGDTVKEYDENMWVPVGCNMFFRKSLIEKYGLFNTDLGFYSKNTLIYGEDSELMFRFKNQGETIIYYPEAKVYHPAPAERIKKSYFKKYFWGHGRGNARWACVPPGTVRYANVPRYLIKHAALCTLRLILTSLWSGEQKKFYYEVRLLGVLASIREYYLNGD